MQDKIKKLIVLANDPLKEYYKKGELIDRYFNPCDFFDEVHFISLSKDEVDEGKVQHSAGRARVKIYAVGKIGAWIFFPFSAGRKKILRLVREIQPDCIRAYNVHVQGFLGAGISVSLGIPLVVSLHSNPDKDIRAHLKIFDIKRRLLWACSSCIFENYALKKAALVICPYEFIKEYVVSRGVDDDKIKVIYHRIYVDKFSVGPQIKVLSSGQPLQILWVSRIYKHKNPENIIKSLKNLNVHLTLIGDGDLFEKMVNLSKEIGVAEKIRFIKAVANSEIDRYYREADVFVSVNDSGGVSKPVMEAMAASLPVVLKKPLWEDKPEFIEDIALVTDGSTEEFYEVFIDLSKNPERRFELGQRGFKRVKEYDGTITEKQEADALISVINSRKNMIWAK